MKNVELYRDKLSEQDAALALRIEAEADNTPARDKGLAIHFGAIEKLRAKGYSYRNIAEWFGERGFKVSHVDVWRAHKNGMDHVEFFAAADNDEEWQEYVKTKREGNVTKYEEVIPEAAAPPQVAEKTPKKSSKAAKQTAKRTRKAAVKK
jgi:hypothetical protein